jgi:hypothetical protein
MAGLARLDVSLSVKEPFLELFPPFVAFATTALRFGDAFGVLVDVGLSNVFIVMLLW